MEIKQLIDDYIHWLKKLLRKYKTQGVPNKRKEDKS